MKKGHFLLLSFLAITFSGCAQQDMFKWEARITFDLPILNPEAIQIAWLDFNPKEKFIKNFNEMRLNKNLQALKLNSEISLKNYALDEVTWNDLFKEIKGNKMYLLTKSGIVYSEGNDTLKQKTKKWLVSKVFFINEKPYCYSIAIEIVNNSKIEIKLNRENMILLTEIYTKTSK
jgi:hypothetical protein